MNGCAHKSVDGTNALSSADAVGGRLRRMVRPEGQKGAPNPEDSIYLKVDGKTVIMDRATAKRFVEAVNSVGFYHGFIE